MIQRHSDNRRISDPDEEDPEALEEERVRSTRTHLLITEIKLHSQNKMGKKGQIEVLRKKWRSSSISSFSYGSRTTKELG